MPEHFSSTAQVLAAAEKVPHRWHRGRRQYAAWVIDADTDAVRARLARLRTDLGDLWRPQHRQPHVTVFVCGFVADEPRHADDIAMRALEAQRHALSTARRRPFELRVGGLDSFDSAAFLRVDDPAQALAPLRRVLQSVHPEVRMAPYVPHLTVGLYRQAHDKRDIARRYAPHRHLPALVVDVRALRLVNYRADDIDSALLTQFQELLNGAAALVLFEVGRKMDLAWLMRSGRQGASLLLATLLRGAASAVTLGLLGLPWGAAIFIGSILIAVNPVIHSSMVADENASGTSTFASGK